MKDAMQPLDPSFEIRVRGSFSRQQFMRHLGAELVSILPGVCEIQVPFQGDLTQQHGFFHAGVSGAIADSAAGYAAFSLMPADSSVLTVEYKLNLLAPARGERLVARASVIKSGRTLKICSADVFAVQQGEEELCATMLSTLIVLVGRPDA